MKKVYVVINQTYDGDILIGDTAYKYSRKAKREATKLNREDPNAGLGYFVGELTIDKTR